jgi:FtsH-binding integral membrane protein
MSLLNLVLIIVVLGLVWWLITSYVPMPQPGKTVVTVIFVVILIIILLQVVGIGDFRVGVK